ncbi:MAG: serine/threonine-protein kinase [Patescibacteria group bacterium]
MEAEPIPLKDLIIRVANCGRAGEEVNTGELFETVSLLKPHLDREDLDEHARATLTRGLGILGTRRVVQEELRNVLEADDLAANKNEVIRTLQVASLLAVETDQTVWVEAKYGIQPQTPASPSVSGPTSITVEPEKPPEDYGSRPWQEVFPGGRLLSEAGLDADVYIEGRHPTVAIKVFRPGRQTQFRNEVAVLKRLQGLPNVVQMIGSAERTTDPYIAKVFVEASKPHPIFDPDFKTFPLSRLEADRIPLDKVESYQAAAAWLLSALEAIVQIHQRGIMVRDFKFDDYLWDMEGRRTVLIDFGNALDIEKRKPSEMASTPEQDATSLIKVLLAKTFPGSTLAQMTLDPDGDANWALYGVGPSQREALARIKRHAQAYGPVAPSFIKIIEMMEGGSNSPQEYLDTTRSYFREVGLLRGDEK